VPSLSTANSDNILANPDDICKGRSGAVVAKGIFLLVVLSEGEEAPL
jgi:hypothetical protein